jgi:hypothetical protein
MRSGAAGIGGASFVLSAVLVAAPLYVSSVSAAALQRQFDERCPKRIGLVLPEAGVGDADAVLRSANRSLEGARGLAPSDRTTFSAQPFAAAGLPSGVDDRVRLLHREGVAGDVELVAGPEGDGVLVPDVWAEVAGLGPGSTITVTLEAGADFEDVEDGEEPAVTSAVLPVAGVYRDLSGLLPPREWCLQSSILAPTANGDPPPSLLLLDDATLAALPTLVLQQLSVQDTVDVRRAGLTAGVAADLAVRFEVAIDEAVQTRIGGGGPIFGQVRAVTELPMVLARARGIADLVRANVRPVQAAGVVAALTLALAAGLLASRRRQTELTTRAVRGEGPVRLSARVAASALLPAAAGAVAGGVAAHLAVRAGGPSPDLGPVLERMAAWSAVATVLTVAGTTSAAATVVARLADSRPRHRRHQVLRLVPWEWAIVPLVVVAGRRLDDVGGAQFLGNETTGVDSLAMAFPMLAATAGALLLARPVVVAARRLRRAKPDADPALLLAMRRLAHDPLSAAAVAGAVALAVATAALGGALSDSARLALEAKATTFVGAESSVAIAGGDRSLPESLAGVATVVHEVRASSGGRRVVVALIDPTTFGDGAALDEGDRALVERLAGASTPADGAVPAIVVGPLPGSTVDLGQTGELDVEVLARPSTFPTSRSSSTLVVVDAADVADARTAAVVLSSLPADRLQAELVAAGRRVTGVVSVDAVITGTSIAAVDWAYAGLRALGAVVVAVLLGVQVARSAARIRQRQLAEVFTHAMGLSRRRAALAEAIEQGVPVGLGLAVGLLVALAVASAAIADLDSARILPPRSALVTPWPTLAAVVAVAVAALVAVVVAGRRQARRSQAAVVLRAG